MIWALAILAWCVLAVPVGCIAGRWLKYCSSKLNARCSPHQQTAARVSLDGMP